MKKDSLARDLSRLVADVKQLVNHAQLRAAQAANAELVRLYWRIGMLIDRRQEEEGWGAAVLPRLAASLQSELPEAKGYSERNLKLMVQFAHEYPEAFDQSELIGQQAVAQLPAAKGQPSVAQIPWGHNVLLMQRVKDRETRRWYVEATIANGWSRDVLATMIKSEAHLRQGRAVTNFDQALASPQSDLAKQSLKDPYVFDFLSLTVPFRERELEANLLRQLEKFLLELGQGFAFVGRQVELQVGGSSYFVDLLFYHLKLRCFVVIELKVGEFLPEHAGKMNFYLNAVDDQLRHEQDAPSIGLILCQERDHLVAEYALRGVAKPIGVSEYELTRALPKTLQSALPTVEEIEAKLAVPDE